MEGGAVGTNWKAQKPKQRLLVVKNLINWFTLRPDLDWQSTKSLDTLSE